MEIKCEWPKSFEKEESWILKTSELNKIICLLSEPHTKTTQQNHSTDRLQQKHHQCLIKTLILSISSETDSELHLLTEEDSWSHLVCNEKEMGFAAADLFSVLKGKPVDYVNIFTSVHSRMPPIFLKNAVKSTAANSSLAPLHCSPGICIFPSFRSLAATPPGNATVSWSEEKPNSLCGKPCCKQWRASIWSPTSNTWVYTLCGSACANHVFACKQFVWSHSYILRFKNTHFMVRNTLKESALCTATWKICLNFEE